MDPFNLVRSNDGIFSNIVVSSANRVILESAHKGKSFTYIIKNNDPKTDT